VKRERDLELRLQSLETLGQAVTAMKSLSAHHFRTVRQALDPARAYRDGVDQMLDRTGARLPAGGGPVGLLVIGGELGFCGAYNARIAEAATALRAEAGPGPSLFVGRRATLYARRRGLVVDRAYSSPASLEGMTEALMQVAEDILTDYIALDCKRFVVLNHRCQGVGVFDPLATTLLPIDHEPPRDAAPPRYVSRDHLARIAVRELLYITLVELLLEALASEHSARLVATQAAEQWLQRQTEVLRRRLSAARREASTQEVIEVATGARVRRRER